jgi:hypothetical protein
MGRPPPRKKARRGKEQLVGVRCYRTKAEEPIGEKLSSNQIRVQLPGMQYHVMPVKDDEQISSIKKKMADVIGVKERNWGIYISQDNKPLRIVEDTTQINQVDRNALHFYPKIVIR